MTESKFNVDFYVKRNRAAALKRYGFRLDENRRVKGTDIWFDKNWVFHRGEEKEAYAT